MYNALYIATFNYTSCSISDLGASAPSQSEEDEIAVLVTKTVYGINGV